MRLRLPGGVLGTSLVLVSILSAPQTPTVPLFNGKDLSGWVNINCGPRTFSVQEGEIHATGAPICEIRTERMYENFVLDVEWMHLTPGGNAGVFIWADALPARGQPFLRAVEVQVLDGRETPNYTSHGDIFPIHGARMTPDRRHPGGWDRSLPTEKRARPAGQWNHYRITADRGRVMLAVNGRVVSGGYDIVPRKGYIALESEGAPVVFRNLRIRELPSAGALRAEQVATADAGYRSIYTGVDLSGWRVDGTDGHFAAAGWQIAADGKGRADAAWLVSTREFGDVDFFIDWRCGAPQENEKPAPEATTRDGRFELRVAALSDPPLAFSCRDRLEAQQSGVEWNRTRVVRRGPELSVELNGQELAGRKAPDPSGATGPIAIRHQGGVVSFANLFVRPVD